MIFITLGSQKFQFNRILKKMDELIQQKRTADEVFAQTGYSDYKPQYYSYRKFLDRNEFDELTAKADLIITHGGTGAIVGAVKKGKKVIAIPRLAKFGEHVDDHQLQITSEFEKMGLISVCYKEEELESMIEEVRERVYCEYTSNTESIIHSIENYIDGL